MADEYMCTLSEASLRKAREELNEDPAERMSAVRTFRQWINDQQHLKANTSRQDLELFISLRGSQMSVDIFQMSCLLNSL